MSLFPAYSADHKQDSALEAPAESLGWLTNESCPPEVGQQVVKQPPQGSVTTTDVAQSVKGDEATKSPQPQQSRSPSPKKKKKKKRKKKKSQKANLSSNESCDEEGKKRKKKHRSKRLQSPSTNSSGARSRSATPQQSTTKRTKVRSKTTRHSRSRSRSRSRARIRGSGSSSRSWSRSESPVPARQSSSKSKVRQPKLRSRRSRSRSKIRRSRSLSRTRRSGSGSRNRRSRSRTRRSRSRLWNRRGDRPPHSRYRKRSQSYSPPGSRRRQRSGSHLRSREYAKNKKMKSDNDKESLCGKVVANSKSVFLEDLHGLVKPEEAFFINTDGDRNNAAFPTTHYSQLASYKVRAKGNLGSTSSASEKHRSKRKALRYFKRTALKLLYSDAVRVTTLSKENPEGEESQKGYVPVEITYAEATKLKNLPQQSEINPLGIYDSTTEQYLSGVGGTKQEEIAQSSREIEYEYWQNQSKVYNEKLGKEPFNISLWLEFVRFQDEAYLYLFHDSDSDRKDTNKKKHRRNQKALAERKISILDSAIKKNFRSVELQFERLEIGKDIWDDKKIKQEWGTLIFNFPNKIRVWHQYLISMQTHFTSFSLTSVVQTFAKCSERLQQMKSGVFLTHSPPADLGRCMVDIAVQLAHVWRQGGHMERSVALFQALIELNLFSPKHASNKDIPLEAKLALFEPFWDSRAPRFGEEKAIGWAQVMNRKQQVEYPEVILGGTQDEEDDLIAQGGPTSKLWLALETSRERRHWMPWEQDPEDCEDPERMVPFEELSPHLFTLDSVDECFYLILQFLKFLGVSDTKTFLSQKQMMNKVQKNSKCDGKSESSEIVFKPQIIETLFDADLFGSHLRFRKDNKKNEILNFDAVGPSLLETSSEEYYQFLCRVVKQATDVFEQLYRKNLTVLYIKLLGSRYVVQKRNSSDKAKLKSFGKELKKQIKSILKLEEFRMYLPVYQEYAKVEETMKHFEDAENVYVTALSVGTATGNALDATNADFPAIMNLYVSYVQLEMRRETQVCDGKHSNNIIYSLCSMVIDGKFSVASGAPAPGGNILKTKKKLNEMLDLHSHSLTVNNDSSAEKDKERLLAIRLVGFLAILQLLTVGFKPACLIFEAVIDKVKGVCKNPVPHKLEDIALPPEKIPKTLSTQEKNKNNEDEMLRILENIYEDYLWLIETSSQLGGLVSDGKMSPVSLRTVIASAIKTAPENQRFLLLLAQHQSWRDLLGGLETHPERSSSIVALVSQVIPHIQRTVTLIANTDEGSLSCGHRLESVLNKAVSQPPGNHCPLLWRLYLALVAATRPKGLKELIYRVLSHCPGVKSVYLDCVRLMPSMLKEIVNLMSEKGLRVRLPLEELQVLTETEMELQGEPEENIVSSNEEEEEDQDTSD